MDPVIHVEAEFYDIKTKNVFGEDYSYVEPRKSVPEGYLGYFASGEKIEIHDGRELPLHNRIETQEAYNYLSS